MLVNHFAAVSTGTYMESVVTCWRSAVIVKHWMKLLTGKTSLCHGVLYDVLVRLKYFIVSVLFGDKRIHKLFENSFFLSLSKNVELQFLRYRYKDILLKFHRYSAHWFSMMPLITLIIPV